VSIGCTFVWSRVVNRSVAGKAAGSGAQSYFGCEDVFFLEALLNELFQVLLEGPTVDSLVPFGFMVGAILLRIGTRGIVLDWFCTSDLWLVLDVVEDLVDREPQ